MRPRNFVLAAAAVLSAASTAAQEQVGIKPSFIDDRGRQAVFNVQFPDAPPLEPSAIDPDTVAGEFKRLCLDAGLDVAQIGKAAADSKLQLSRSPLRFSGDRKTPAFDFEGWHGTSADVRIWTGDPEQFRRLPFFVVDSGVVVTGPVKSLSPQCNLAVASTELADFAALVTAVSAALGADAAKNKSSKRWGQAQWTIPGPNGSLLISLRVDDLNKDAQTLHLGVLHQAKQAEQ